MPAGHFPPTGEDTCVTPTRLSYRRKAAIRPILRTMKSRIVLLLACAHVNNTHAALPPRGAVGKKADRNNGPVVLTFGLPNLPFAMKTPLILILGTMLTQFAGASDAEALFVRRVFPMFQEKCLACHGNDEKKIKADFDMR